MKELQNDYNKITNFNSDWLSDLAKKYNLSENQVLDKLEL